MPTPPEVHDWIARSEVDHVGPFVNAWAAFNAWYRYISGQRRDALGLEYVRTRPNAVRGAVLPMLDPLTHETADALAFKGAIASLHAALEAFQLETLHDDALERVSFRSVPIFPSERLPIESNYRGTRFRVERANGQLVTIVRNAAGDVIGRVEQAAYDLAGLMAAPAVAALSQERRLRTRGLYVRCDPRPMMNLLSGDEPVINAGGIQFRCTCDQLFGGVIVTIYRMRNMLLHGELKPDPQALACYEPAYRLLRRMLQEIN